MAQTAGTAGDGEHEADDAELAKLVVEFTVSKTYRPTDGMVEPDEVPPGPSGTAMGDESPTARGTAGPDGT
ncbi:hypothetical protein ACFV2V_01045 [Streptomyces sp. NPDC059698]|uniref:hypothetical protein n=1 Tax=unclassified Streptomyces TaxID=2593676 RepID=UPI00093B5465|nr:hypothetical protein [Streptomyces sp. CB02366]OKJ37829.1 hypothetical protein AMK24_08910 [Streptomyces sp. CB02366]TVP33312.1 hypothetical protein A3L22_18875 [Streptomyces griseus subsp. griseus]WSS58463.1 hypothetical protein OG543_25320 [Streptomyces sp. NBC_01178]